MKITRRRAGILSLAACAAVGTALTLTTLSASAVETTADPLSVLETKGPTSLLPATADLSLLGNGGVSPETVVDLGQDENGTYFAGTDVEGNVCLLTLVPATELLAAACAAPEVLHETGIALAVSSKLPTGALASNEMYLLPDGVDINGQVEKSSGLTLISPNLLVGESVDSTKTLAVGTLEGHSFDIPLYDAEDQ